MVRISARRLTALTAALLLGAGLATGCSSPKKAQPAGDATPIKFGFIYSQTGLLAGYAPPYLRGFDAGLAFATHGTMKVGDRPIQIVRADDGGDPAKAVAAAKDLIGQGIKVIGGTGSSSVAVQLAPLAAQNKVLYIDGPAAADGLTGANKYTFRAGRQTLQDVANIASAIGPASGKKILVFAQDNTFGQGNLAAVKAVETPGGATVTSVLVPPTATDVTPFAVQAKQAGADVVYVSWAGSTGTAMWQALQQQGVLTGPKVVTGLDQRATWGAFGPSATSLSFAAHYVDGATANPEAHALKAQAPGGPVDTFGPDGFNLAQMLVHAAEAGGGEDVDKMVAALEGWSFEGVKGQMTIRAADHALLQPMFQVTLAGTGPDYQVTVSKTLTAAECAPPVSPMKG
jgi:branched-chain amino acid transport system substrate-binding protein